MQERGYTGEFRYRTNYFNLMDISPYQENLDYHAVSSRRHLDDSIQDVIQVDCGNECDQVRRIIGMPEFTSKLNELSGDNTIVHTGSAVTLSGSKLFGTQTESAEPQYKRAAIALGVLFCLALIAIAALVHQLRQTKGSNSRDASEEKPVNLDKLHSVLEQGGLSDTLAQAHTPKKLLNNKKKKAHSRPSPSSAFPTQSPTAEEGRLPSPKEFVLTYLEIEI
jgi:hypothetical protein